LLFGVLLQGLCGFPGTRWDGRVWCQYLRQFLVTESLRKVSVNCCNVTRIVTQCYTATVTLVGLYLMTLRIQQFQLNYHVLLSR